jgi:oligopeptide/dipeptide ABC transporter ATP-binding protein
MNDKPTVLEFREVSKHFPVRSPILRRRTGELRAVDGVSLKVESAETVALVGESGSGKSTLGRLGVRLLTPTAGMVLLDGADVTSIGVRALRPHRRRIQMVFQDPYSSLDPHATIGNSLSEPLRVHMNLRGAALQKRIEQLLDMVHLSRTYVDRIPSEFSGGQLQRLALARALAVEPDVIVADEPVSSLDVSTQAQILKLLEELQARLGAAYLFITHDLSVVDHISERVAVMYLGRVVEMGPTSEVIAAPKHPYTQALLSAVPVLNPATRRERIVLHGDPPSPGAIPTGCRFHTRCPSVMEICRREDPAEATFGRRTVSCHLHTSREALVAPPQATNPIGVSHRMS